jgi:hypothetical protein
VTKLLKHFLVAFSVWLTLSQNGSVAAQSKTQRVSQIPSLSLCQLTKHIDRHVGRIVRVRLIPLGMGGHSPFFIAAEGCEPGTVTIMWARFDSPGRIASQLENRFIRAVGLNSDRDGPKSESFLIGRVRAFENGSGYKLMMSIRDVATLDRNLVPSK